MKHEEGTVKGHKSRDGRPRTSPDPRKEEKVTTNYQRSPREYVWKDARGVGISKDSFHRILMERLHSNNGPCPQRKRSRPKSLILLMVLAKLFKRPIVSKQNSLE